MAAGAATAGACGAPSRPGRPPNVVFILTDDQAPRTLGVYGNSEIQTPHCDRLARGGALLTQSYCATPVCSPSRATLLTGQIPSQHGIHDWISEGNEGAGAHRFLADEPTFPEVLAANGYRCGLSGKWHMGASAEPQEGFDYWFAMPTGGSRYQDPEMYWEGEKREYPGYATDVITDKALEFLDQARGGPFFCFVSYNAPHTPYADTPAEYMDLYRDSPFATFPGEPLNEPIAHNLSRQNVGNRESKIHYYAMVSAIDANVGRIAQRLEDLGVADDTLVVYLSDHGFLLEQHGLWGKGNTSWPYNMYDESMLTPGFFYHPAGVPAGRKIETPVSFYDFAPTLLDYLGLPPLEGPKPLPGRSYAQLLRGENIPEWGPDVYGEYQYCRMVREPEWKLIRRTEGFPDELYHLADDPAERRNVAGDPQFADQEERLGAKLTAWFETLGCGNPDLWKRAEQETLPSYRRVQGSGPA